MVDTEIVLGIMILKRAGLSVKIVFVVTEKFSGICMRIVTVIPVNCTDPTGHAYSRAKAVAYAMKWAMSRNTQYQDFGRHDCANFVSQCLHAGGFTMNNSWHSYHKKKKYGYIWGTYYYWDISDAWKFADGQYKYFKNSGTVKKINYKNQIKYLAKKVKVGDPLYFDDTGDGKMNHATIISAVNSKEGKICYAGHSNNRRYWGLHQTFKNNEKKNIYVIHMG